MAVGARDKYFTGKFKVKRDPPLAGTTGPSIFYRFVVDHNHVTDRWSTLSKSLVFGIGDPGDASLDAAVAAFGEAVLALSDEANNSAGNQEFSKIKTDKPYGLKYYTMGPAIESIWHTWKITGCGTWTSNAAKTVAKLPVIDFKIESYLKKDDVGKENLKIKFPAGSPLNEVFTLMIGAGGNLYVKLKPCNPLKSISIKDPKGNPIGLPSGASPVEKCMWGYGEGSKVDTSEWWIQLTDAECLAAYDVDIAAAVKRKIVGQFNINNKFTCGSGDTPDKYPNDIQECYQFVKTMLYVAGGPGPGNLFGKDGHTKKCKNWKNNKKCARMQAGRSDCLSCGPRGGNQFAKIGIGALIDKGFADNLGLVSVNEFSTKEPGNNASPIAWTSADFEGSTRESLGELPGSQAKSTAWGWTSKYTPKTEDSFIYAMDWDVQFDYVRNMSWEMFAKWRQVIRVTGTYDWDTDTYKNIDIQGVEFKLQKAFLNRIYSSSAHMKVAGKFNNNFKVGFTVNLTFPTKTVDGETGDETDDGYMSSDISAYIEMDDLFTHAYAEDGKEARGEKAWDRIRVDAVFGSDIGGGGEKKKLTELVNASKAAGKDYELSVLKKQAAEHMDSLGIAGNDKLWIESVSVSYELHLPNGINFHANLTYDVDGVNFNPKIDWEYSVTDALTLSWEFGPLGDRDVQLGINYNKEIHKTKDPFERLWKFLPGPSGQSTGWLTMNADCGLTWNKGMATDEPGILEPNLILSMDFGNMLSMDYDLLTGEGAIAFRRRLWQKDPAQAANVEWQDPSGCQKFKTTGKDCEMCKGRRSNWSKETWNTCYKRCGNCLKGHIDAWIHVDPKRTDPDNPIFGAGLDMVFEKNLMDFGPVFGRVTAFAHGTLAIQMGGAGGVKGVAKGGFRFRMKMTAGVKWHNRILEYLGFPFNLSISPVIGAGFEMTIGSVSSFGTKAEGAQKGFAFDAALGFAQLGIEMVDGARAELRRRHISVFGRIPLVGGALASLPILSILGPKEKIDEYAFRVGTERAVRLFTMCQDQWDAAYRKMRKTLSNRAVGPPSMTNKVNKGLYDEGNCQGKSNKNSSGDPGKKGHPHKHECLCHAVLAHWDSTDLSTTAKNKKNGYAWCHETLDWRKNNPLCTFVEGCFDRKRVSLERGKYVEQFFPTQCDNAAPNDQSKCVGDNITLNWLMDVWSEREQIVFDNMMAGNDDKDNPSWTARPRGTDVNSGQRVNILTWFWEKAKAFFQMVKDFLGIFKAKKEQYCRGLDYSRCSYYTTKGDTFTSAYRDFILGGNDTEVNYDKGTRQQLDGFIGRRFLIGNANSKGLYEGAGGPNTGGAYQRSLKECLQTPHLSSGSNMAIDPDHSIFRAKQIWRFLADDNGCSNTFHRDIEKAKLLLSGGHSVMAANYAVCCCNDPGNESCDNGVGGDCCCSETALRAACIANIESEDAVEWPSCIGETDAELALCCTSAARKQFQYYMKFLKTSLGVSSPQLEKDPYKTWLGGAASCQKAPTIISDQGAARVVGPAGKCGTGSCKGHSKTHNEQACHSDDKAAVMSLNKMYDDTRSKIMNNVARPELRGPLFTNDPAADLIISRKKDGSFEKRNMYDLTAIPEYPQIEAGHPSYYANFGEVLMDLDVLAGLKSPVTLKFALNGGEARNAPAWYAARWSAFRRLRTKIGYSVGDKESFSKNIHPVQHKAMGYANMAAKLLARNLRVQMISQWNKSKISKRLGGMTGKPWSNITGTGGTCRWTKESCGLAHAGFIKYAGGWTRTRAANPPAGYDGTNSGNTAAPTKRYWQLSSNFVNRVGRSFFMFNLRLISRRLGVWFYCNGDDIYCEENHRPKEMNYIPGIDPNISSYEGIFLKDPDAAIDHYKTIHEWHLSKWEDTKIIGKDSGYYSGFFLKSNPNPTFASKTGNVYWVQPGEILKNLNQYTNKGGVKKWAYPLGKNFNKDETTAMQKSLPDYKKFRSAWYLGNNALKYGDDDFFAASWKWTNHGTGMITAFGASAINYNSFVGFGVSLDFLLNGTFDPTVNDFEVLKQISSGDASVPTSPKISKEDQLNDLEQGQLCCYWGGADCTCKDENDAVQQKYFEAGNVKHTADKEPCWGTTYGRPVGYDDDWGDSPAWHDLEV